MAAWRHLLSPIVRATTARISGISVQANYWRLPLSLTPQRSIYSSSILCNPVVPFNLPDVGEAIMTVVITEWLVKPGDSVSMGDPVCEVQSDKSSATIYCPFDGTVEKLMYEVDDTAKKDEPLLMINVKEGVSTDDHTSTDNVEQDTTPSSVSGTGKDTGSKGGGVLAAPAVRRIASENNIDLTMITGSGKDGRILKEDVLRFMESGSKPPTTEEQKEAPAAAKSSPTSTVSDSDRVEPIKGFKSVMVQTMTRSGQIPQFGYCDEIEMSELIKTRNLIKTTLANKEDIRFSYMPLIIKALSLSLREFPILNSHVNESCTEITYKHDHNIGVAVDTTLGLVVPNIKQVQDKSIIQIARDLNNLHDRSLKGDLGPSDIVGGTFSLSNIGAVGGTYTRPMLLPPEVCIGAFGKIQEVARFNPDNTVVRSHVMYVSWSADHRVIDGATVARFSNLWKSYIEDPQLMLTELK